MNVWINRTDLYAQPQLVKIIQMYFHVAMRSIALLVICYVMDIHNVKMNQGSILLYCTNRLERNPLQFTVIIGYCDTYVIHEKSQYPVITLAV